MSLIKKLIAAMQTGDGFTKDQICTIVWGTDTYNPVYMEKKFYTLMTRVRKMVGKHNIQLFNGKYYLLVNKDVNDISPTNLKFKENTLYFTSENKNFMLKLTTEQLKDLKAEVNLWCI